MKFAEIGLIGTIKICGGMTHGQVVSQSQWCGDGSEWYGCVWTQQEPAKSVEASGIQSNAPEAMNVGSITSVCE